MLKNIPEIISPKLMKTIMEMGHGDTIVIGDGNFPAASNNENIIRCEGNNVSEILDAILKFFPLDTYIGCPVSLMKVTEKDSITPSVWENYRSIIQKHHNNFEKFNFIERFKFYQKSTEAYAIITTSDEALYANVILQKGVVKK